MKDWLDEIKWDSDGLVPAIAQDYKTGRVLMMAWMNREALSLTAAEQRAIYWSRSRGKLWRKGEESVETIIAAKDAEISGDYSDVIYETADLWFHSLVMLAQLGQHPQAVLDELDRRFGLSGHAEKASRPSA